MTMTMHKKQTDLDDTHRITTPRHKAAYYLNDEAVCMLPKSFAFVLSSCVF